METHFGAIDALLLSVVRVSAVCCLLSAVCCLLSAVCCLLSAVFCVFFLFLLSVAACDCVCMAPGSTDATYIAVLYGTMDQDWLNQGTPEPNVPPQSHVINARTNRAWRKQNEDFVIRGRTYFTSKVLSVLPCLHQGL